MFNKKNKRKITVDDKEYFWSATGNDGWINLFVMTDTQGSSKLICSFDYHHIYTTYKTVAQENEVIHGSNQFVITPYIVRQAIEYGLSQGWKPFEQGIDLNLGHIDDKIDLRLDRNRAENFKLKTN